MEKLVEQLGIKSLSKSQVSGMARHLDAQVEAFRNRPLVKVPESAQPWVATLVRTMFDQPDAARGDLFAFTGFPREFWRQIWVGIFSNRAAIIRLVGAVKARLTPITTSQDTEPDQAVEIAA